MTHNWPVIGFLCVMEWQDDDWSSGGTRTHSVFLYICLSKRGFPSRAQGGVSLGKITGRHKVHPPAQSPVPNIPHPDKQALGNTVTQKLNQFKMLLSLTATLTCAASINDSCMLNNHPPMSLHAKTFSFKLNIELPIYVEILQGTQIYYLLKLSLNKLLVCCFKELL